MLNYKFQLFMQTEMASEGQTTGEHQDTKQSVSHKQKKLKN